MKKGKDDKDFIKKPVYPGGPKALNAFIRSNLRYPAQALQQRIQGTVRVKYSIDYTGKVIETQVISKLGYGCDEEAERVVRLLKFQVSPPRGLKIKYHKDININFRLPATPEPSGPEIKVKVVPSKKSKTPVKKKKSYTITIDL